MKTSKRILSVVMAMCIVSVAIGGAMLVDTPEEEDSDAIVFIPLVWALGLVLATTVTSAVASYAVGYQWGSMTDPMEEYARTVEADAVRDSIALGLTYYTNALTNYDQIWELTEEHWIRQAELTSSFLWSDDGSYDPYSTLMTSGVYQNTAYMLWNAAAQVNEHLDSIQERMTLWNGTATYADSMSVGWVYGTTESSSKTSFGGELVAATTVTSDAADRVYISGGDIWASAGSTITPIGGSSIALSAGWTDLDANASFEPGIYELQKDCQYGGCMLPVMDTQTATVTTGVVMTFGGVTKLATWDRASSKVIVDGAQYDSLSIRVTPDDGTPAATDVTGLLEDYSTLMQTMKGTMAASNTAAGVVWNIYDRAGSACTYLTTLSVPNNYDNVNISAAQQEIITILAMEQLSDYYTANSGEIKTGDYQMSDESLTLFCRGDIRNSTGTTIYSNVIFTPFFYLSDVTLANGSNVLTQPSVVAIWDGAGVNLSVWDGSVGINDTNLITIESGWEIYVHEMKHDGATVGSLALDMRDISIIEPGEIDPTPTEEPPDNIASINWLQVILIIIGLIAVAIGAYMRRIDYILIGCACVAGGVFLAPAVWGWLGSWGVV